MGFIRHFELHGIVDVVRDAVAIFIRSIGGRIVTRSKLDSVGYCVIISIGKIRTAADLVFFGALVNDGNVLDFRANEACGRIGIAAISAGVGFLGVVPAVAVGVGSCIEVGV